MFLEIVWENVTNFTCFWLQFRVVISKQTRDRINICSFVRSTYLCGVIKRNTDFEFENVRSRFHKDPGNLTISKHANILRELIRE